MNNIILEYVLGSNELVIRFIKRNHSSKLFYSIYGNTNFKLKGLFDVSDTNQPIPRITIDAEDNSIFFIKFKNIVNERIIEEYKFVELEKLKETQNLSMNILDKKTENLFKSINMDDEDDDDEVGGGGEDDDDEVGGGGEDDDDEVGGGGEDDDEVGGGGEDDDEVGGGGEEENKNDVDANNREYNNSYSSSSDSDNDNNIDIKMSYSDKVKLLNTSIN